MISISNELRELLYERGAALTGYADLSSVVKGNLQYGVSVAVCVPKTIVESIVDGPNPEYYKVYYELNDKLNQIITAGAEFLTQKGYEAFARTTDVVVTDENQRTELPHKTVAVHAGMGWIGKSNLLVTKEFGSAVRISSLLTNAPLDFNEPCLISNCGACKICTDACPGRAIYGNQWSLGTDRDGMFNLAACRKAADELSIQYIGKASTLCGKCFVVCPYTKRYLKSLSKN